MNLPLRLTVRVLICKEDQVCLGIKRYKEGNINCYTFPGGGVDEGDTMVETVIKESLEEVGFTIKNIEPLNVSLAARHNMHVQSRNAHFSGTDTHYYTAKYVGVDNSFLNKEGDELEIIWVTPKKAIELIKEGPLVEFNNVRLQALTALIEK